MYSLVREEEPATSLTLTSAILRYLWEKPAVMKSGKKEHGGGGANVSRAVSKPYNHRSTFPPRWVSQFYVSSFLFLYTVQYSQNPGH